MQETVRIALWEKDLAGIKQARRMTYVLLYTLLHILNY